MPQTATRVPAARRRRLRRIVIFLVTALSLIGVSVTAASVGAGSRRSPVGGRQTRGSPPRHQRMTQVSRSPSSSTRHSCRADAHACPVLELTAAILPIAPAGPGGSAPRDRRICLGVRWGIAAAGSGIVVSSSELRALPMSGAA